MLTTHETWMRLALQLAEAAEGQTSPNPMVGAVVVKDGQIVGAGAHLKAGTPHAEVHALNMAGDDARGSTLYVTLEPCNHYGRTPPCTGRIIEAGVRRVVVGCVDPDEKVSGEGIKRLRESGIEVVEGILREECLRLNEAYFHHRKTKKPFVTLKMATTLDGKIAAYNGDSRWVTGHESRAHVHQIRKKSDAILVGVGTVLADDPQLTARIDGEPVRQPVRIVLDSRLRTPLDAQIVNTQAAPTWIFTTPRCDRSKVDRLIEKGVKVIVTQSEDRVDIDEVLSYLGQQGILSLIVEGGSQVNASFLRCGHVQKVMAYLAPKLLGGKDSKSAIAGENPERMKEAVSLKHTEIRRFGEDFLLTGYISYEKPAQG
ncbi:MULTISPECIES: bifunctional diaminohydroxyphosphoribosylaminopyrimidine deaminase/5-amino-6-(5-phosphoribosylamino)uracil reductase RibD [Thermoactinomyces]|jgi:diaminohydroxyphosphoribosylaminopyrimidine deaminase / 5-amino-6-(5-phosphoribosylamino)uracil reductase|uniref:Riboflavin biosynthesis protein RibD n=1 Tax=Thermoactinomyces vulgaris TaxID=2026 RepID=A0ABS0QDS5_THEVU|nr:MULTISPECIES: bifunctional diaminohydroxyphosphoribosylaminopyrimidine deaminase/5-amino-6-(5-phosphoribosylamino)uracil reductase RibD [Thermoactinomyces]KFZ39648.1 5-amino-6-(5-phosphoribosylamino)uracil reductase [Thermoactinomyces sp. Gus2-1]KYQ87796.1 bifunctional diaminohydroxyphosphoribosylaminopyrimidine deaminase/5-amino-6-(5-phosphoribosylamino)uracil reductase [Thermoactinomyces sp. AS95]MBA4550373.1 bifunctional diaminohydroxyphosphoribosylaminopyrimidine deaminase/5-amino-6-(5-ph